jgi:catechol-2,3-dioxygenase
MAERPAEPIDREEWPRDEEGIAMVTEPLDLRSLLAELSD